MPSNFVRTFVDYLLYFLSETGTNFEAQRTAADGQTTRNEPTRKNQERGRTDEGAAGTDIVMLFLACDYNPQIV